MGQGYTRQSAADIVTGNTIEATPLNTEFNAIRDAFDSSAGHSHDGTVGEGPKISLTTSVQGVLPVANGGVAGIHKLNGALAPAATDDSGDGYAVGSIWIDTGNDKAYICVDATLNAAKWVYLGSAGSGAWQPLDADLTALAGLVSAANKLPYFTGSGTASLADLTAYARTLLDDADAGTALTTLGVSTYAKTLLDDIDAATARATLGLTIGTNVQAYDATLNNYAALTTAANKAVYYTAADTAATYDLTAFARTLLDDADATTARATLGLTIGTNVQAYDAGLTSLAGLVTTGKLYYLSAADTWSAVTIGSGLTFSAGTLDTAAVTEDATITAIAGLAPVADQFIYFTGADVAAVGTVTAAARSILDDASVGAIRTTLGVGTTDSPTFANPTVTTLTATNINLGSTDTTLSRSAAGKLAVEGVDVLLAGTADQTITGGARVTPLSLGNLSAATITPDPGDRPIQTITNNGAGSILPGSNEGQYTLVVSNTTGAGAITTTGWTTKGDSFDTTTTSVFVCSCVISGSVKLMFVTKYA